MKTPIYLVFSFFVFFKLHGSPFQGGSVVGWGSNVGGEATGVSRYNYATNKTAIAVQFKDDRLRSSTGTVIVAGQVLSNIVAISSGPSYSLALKGDGSVIGWGSNGGGCAVPPSGLHDVVAIAAGNMHSLALKKDGTVVAWGDGRYGETSVPEGLSNVVALAAGYNSSMALKKDGTIVSWGESIKIPAGLSNVVAIATFNGGRNGIGRGGSALALKDDGTVIVLEWDEHAARTHAQPGLTNMVAIAAGAVHNLALKKDGTVIGWGFNGNGELNMPTGLTNVVAIAASGKSFPASGFSIALKGNGQVVAWGVMDFHPVIVPAGLSNVVAISAGSDFSLAVTTNNVVIPSL